MEENLVTIYTAANAVQAQLLRDQLVHVGIHAWVINEALVGGAGELPVGWSTSPRVVVANENAVTAREIALRFDALAAQHAHGTHRVRNELDQAEKTIDDAHYVWPRCPQCQERRLAVCPFCQTSGNQFPLAYAGPGETHEQPVMVECPTCDEAFYPQFFKRCEHCGHTFTDGVAVREPRGLAPSAALPIEKRTWILLGATIAVCLALGIYFWALVNAR